MNKFFIDNNNSRTQNRKKFELYWIYLTIFSFHLYLSTSHAYFTVHGSRKMPDTFQLAAKCRKFSTKWSQRHILMYIPTNNNEKRCVHFSFDYYSQPKRWRTNSKKKKTKLLKIKFIFCIWNAPIETSTKRVHKVEIRGNFCEKSGKVKGDELGKWGEMEAKEQKSFTIKIRISIDKAIFVEWVSVCIWSTKHTHTHRRAQIYKNFV